MKLWMALTLTIISNIACTEVVPLPNECLLTPNEGKHNLITYEGYDLLAADAVTKNEEGDTEVKDCVVPEQLNTLQFSVDYKLEKYNEKQTAKFHQVIEKVLIILASKEFKKRVLNHEYQGKKQYSTPEVNGKTLTNQEVYKTILSGTEQLLKHIPSEKDDGEMDLHLKMYYKRNSVVGWTKPSIMTIHTNSRYYNTNPHGKVGANFVHEWLHKLGFGHDFKRTARRPYSVPYAVGSIINELIQKMNNTNEEITPHEYEHNHDHQAQELAGL
jgi:hypothetical protein